MTPASSQATHLWWSMKGFMPSITPAGILSISSNMKREASQRETLPRIMSWVVGVVEIGAVGMGEVVGVVGVVEVRGLV